ncbi:MAG: YceK/YidQ family lipoprotein [Planctomycetota bacterium]
MARPTRASGLRAALLAAALLLPAGCATMNQIDAQEQGPAVFGGLRYGIGQFGEDHAEGGDLAMVILDLPFSFVLDIVALPFSIPNELYWGGIFVDPVRPAIERRAPPPRLRAY